MENRNRLIVRRWCSGHSFFCRVIQQLGFLTRKFKPTPSALCSALDFKYPSLRSDSGLAAKRRAEALHVVFLFYKASEPSTRAAALCVLSHDTYVATKDERWVRCSPCSLGPSPRRPTASCPRRPTASCGLAAVMRGDCVRASRLYS